MTKIIGRIIDGVATLEPDLIEWRECPDCAELVKRRSRSCKSCGLTYSDEKYTAVQEAYAKLEEKLKREKSEAPRG